MVAHEHVITGIVVSNAADDLKRIAEKRHVAAVRTDRRAGATDAEAVRTVVAHQLRGRGGQIADEHIVGAHTTNDAGSNQIVREADEGHEATVGVDHRRGRVSVAAHRARGVDADQLGRVGEPVVHEDVALAVGIDTGGDEIGRGARERDKATVAADDGAAGGGIVARNVVDVNAGQLRRPTDEVTDEHIRREVGIHSVRHQIAGAAREGDKAPVAADGYRRCRGPWAGTARRVVATVSAGVVDADQRGRTRSKVAYEDVGGAVRIDAGRDQVARVAGEGHEMTVGTDHRVA